jgi:hypothetical protein
LACPSTKSPWHWTARRNSSRAWARSRHEAEAVQGLREAGLVLRRQQERGLGVVQVARLEEARAVGLARLGRHRDLGRHVGAAGRHGEGQE